MLTTESSNCHRAFIARLPLVLGGVVSGAFLLILSAAVAAPLSKEDGKRLAYALARDMDRVSLAVVAKESRAEDAAALVEELGGDIFYRFEAVDYLNVSLPTAAARAFASDDSIAAVAVAQPDDDYMKYVLMSSQSDSGRKGLRRVQNANVDTPADAHQKADESWPPRPSVRPLTHPHSILKDMDAERLRERKPTFDGRGVVIAHVEWWPDFLAPELQTAYDLDGNPILKFVDLINTPDYAAGEGGKTLSARSKREWFELGEPFSGQSAVSFKSERFQLPDKGAYRIGEFVFEVSKAATARSADHLAYATLAKTYAPKTLGEGGAAREAIVIPFVWSETDQTLRLDLDGDNDFANDEAVAPFSTSQTFGVMGRDNPATPERETIGYAVQKDADHVAIMLGISSHASLVAGAAAGSFGEQGRIEGVAPGAQLLAVSTGFSVTSFARALVTAFSDPRTDIVLAEGLFPVNGLYDLRDGRSALAILHQRLVDHFDKPSFFTAFNTTGLGTAADPGNAPGVNAVGAGQSAAAVFAHNGARVRHDVGLHWSGAEGPSGDGALKPDFLAPANPVSLGVGFGAGGRLDGVFQLPPGYRSGAGTSTATPVAAGAAPILVSAAKQSDVAWSAGRINKALRSTARFLKPFPAYKQGRGLIQVGAAWRWMETVAADAPLIDIRVDAPVRTMTSAHLPTPHRGRGLFEREGWRAGDYGERVVMLTRTTGPDRPMKFTIEWAGDDHGVFSSARSVRLPLNTPVSFTIRINPKTEGDFSALALLKNRQQPGAIAYIPATIIVPYAFTAENAYRKKLNITLDRPGRKNIFLKVPDGTAVLNAGFSISPERARSRLDFQARLARPTNDAFRIFLGPNDKGAGAMSVAAPEAGVWQLVLQHSGDRARYDWSARGLPHLPPVVLEVEFSISSVSIEASGDLDHTIRDLTLTNRQAGFTGRAHGVIGARNVQAGSLQADQHAIFDFDVEPGASFLITELLDPRGEDTDFDLYLFNCSEADCRLERQSANYRSSERLFIENPAPGRWRAVIVRDAQGGADAAFTFQRVIVHPRFGDLHLTDGRAAREPGASWTAKAGVLFVDPLQAVDGPVGVVMVLDPTRRQSRGGAVSRSGEMETIPDHAPLGLEYVANIDGEKD